MMTLKHRNVATFFGLFQETTEEDFQIDDS